MSNLSANLVSICAQDVAMTQNLRQYICEISYFVPHPIANISAQDGRNDNMPFLPEREL